MKRPRHDECVSMIVKTSEFKKELPGVISAIVESCDPDDELSHLDLTALPSREVVRSIISDLEAILFPGFFGTQEVERSHLPYYLGELVYKIHEALSTQITRVYIHRCQRVDDHVCTRCAESGEKNALDLLRRIPALRRKLIGDVKAALRGDPAAKSYDEIIFSYPGVQAITIYRLAHELYLLGVPTLPRIMTEIAHGITGIDIHPGATIGENFFIDHGTGVVVGETTVIGDNVRLYQGVTLGALSVEDADGLRGVKRHPTIEDDVTIYAGATILGGGVVVGKGSTVGGNVWLIDSIEPDSMVTVKPQHRHFKNHNGEDPAATASGGRRKEKSQ